jgi:quercetin 2,3-dioxygenase
MKNNRRTFMSKILLGSAGLLSAPLLTSLTKQSIAKEMKAIKKIRALGFQWETQDPFLFCVHHEDYYPKGKEDMSPDSSLSGRLLGQDFTIKDGWRMYHGKKIPGFPGHPHRGFETLTIVRKGMVDHADSAGGAGRYGNGDLQWMTAGKGLMHSEMFPLLKTDTENTLELFQVWLNLPRKSKMVEPAYKMFWNEDIPTIQKDGTTIEILVGNLYDENAPTPPQNSWAFDKNNHVGVYNIKMEPNSTLEIPATATGVNRTLYVYEGSELSIENETIPEYHAVDVESTANLTLRNGNTISKILVLQGRPIDEPVVQHGPFVMNSRQEIQEAFQDYQATQFGGWPWERYDQVHDRSKGRFAIYTDGRKEVKG